MKKFHSFTTVLILILALLFTLLGMGAESAQESVIFKSNPENVQAYIGPQLSYGLLKNKPSFFKGGNGGLIFKNKFYAGVFAETLASNHSSEKLSVIRQDNRTKNYSNLKTNFGYAGIMIGYIYNTGKTSHLRLGAGVGLGSISLSENDLRLDFRENIINDGVFLLHPKAELGFNLFRNIRSAIGVGYRWVTGANSAYRKPDGSKGHYFNNIDFSGPVISLSLNIGNFNS